MISNLPDWRSQLTYNKFENKKINDLYYKSKNNTDFYKDQENDSYQNDSNSLPDEQILTYNYADFKEWDIDLGSTFNPKENVNGPTNFRRLKKLHERYSLETNKTKLLITNYRKVCQELFNLLNHSRVHTSINVVANIDRLKKQEIAL